MKMIENPEYCVAKFICHNNKCNGKNHCVWNKYYLNELDDKNEW
jgi:hypothetical protein